MMKPKADLHTGSETGLPVRAGTDQADPYRKTWRILSSDVDPGRRLRLSCLCRELQEAAIAHTTALGVGRDKTLDRGLLWVVTAYSMRIDRLPEYDEDVTLVSWPGDMLHIFFPRFFALLDGEGQLLVRASSMWVLMDAQTRALAFPEEHGIQIPGMPVAGAQIPLVSHTDAVQGALGAQIPLSSHADAVQGPLGAQIPLSSHANTVQRAFVTADASWELPLPARLRREDLPEAGHFQVPASYADINGHMNNARYFELAEDLLASGGRDIFASPENPPVSGNAHMADSGKTGMPVIPTPREVTIEYSGEVRAGDSVALSSSLTEKGLTLCGQTEKPVFRLRMTF